MRVFLLNVIAVTVFALTALGFETGLISAGNAFFVIFSVIVLYTGYQFLSRQNLPLRDAVFSIFAEPSSHGAKANYIAYLACTGLGLVVIAQTFTYL